MFLGIGLLIVGSLGTLSAAESSSVTVFFAATLVSGIGFGAGFDGAMRTLVPLAGEHERSGCSRPST